MSLKAMEWSATSTVCVQSCARVYSYYWQCLPFSQLPVSGVSGLEITGSSALDISYPHVGPNPDLTLVIAAPQVKPISCFFWRAASKAFYE